MIDSKPTGVSHQYQLYEMCAGIHIQATILKGNVGTVPTEDINNGGLEWFNADFSKHFHCFRFAAKQFHSSNSYCT